MMSLSFETHADNFEAFNSTFRYSHAVYLTASNCSAVLIYV